MAQDGRLQVGLGLATIVGMIGLGGVLGGPHFSVDTIETSGKLSLQHGDLQMTKAEREIAADIIDRLYMKGKISFDEAKRRWKILDQ